MEKRDQDVRERRVLPAAGAIEFRAAPEGGSSDSLGTLVGVAVPWDSLSERLWTDYETGLPVFERFARGAFTSCLASERCDPRCLVEHDPRMLVGRLSAGTLRVSETERGLEYEVDVPNTTLGRDLVVSVRRGDLTQSSFSFRIAKEGQVWLEEEDRLVREVRTVGELFDVSPVTYPAYTESSIEVAQRSLSESRKVVEAPPAGRDPRDAVAELLSRGIL